jgi:phenylalanyl-tRNA synthetase beta chain
VDPDGLIHALERATQLMCEVGSGAVAAERLDEYPSPIQHPRLNLRVSRANQVLGTDYTSEQISNLLRRLHLPALAVDDQNLALQVPSFRGDLEREVDLIEEIARLGGYDSIPVTLPHGVLATRRPGPEVRLREKARDLLLGLGFFEIITYAFQPDRLGSLVETDLEATPG